MDYRGDIKAPLQHAKTRRAAKGTSSSPEIGRPEDCHTGPAWIYRADRQGLRFSMLQMENRNFMSIPDPPRSTFGGVRRPVPVLGIHAGGE